MKIAMLTTWDEACGIAEYAHALVDALQPLVEVKVVPIKHGMRGAEYFKSLAEACNDCDLVHVQHEYIFFGGRDPWNYYWPHFIKALRKPYIVSIHTWLKPFTGGPLWKRVLRALRDGVYALCGWKHYLELGQFNHAKKILVHTQAHYHALQHRGVNTERLELVPQGVPGHIPEGNAEAARKKWSLSGQVVTILGFLIPSKGHLLALEAWKKAPPDATLMIIGMPFSQADEVYARAVTQAAQAFPETVRLTGYLEEQDLSDLLAASDVALMPYTGGTSSYALSRVLAQARPVLASDIDYFKEVFSESKCLVLFASGDADDLAARLQILLGNEAQQKRLSQAAAQWSAERSWDKIASRILKVYTEPLS